MKPGVSCELKGEWERTETQVALSGTYGAPQVEVTVQSPVPASSTVQRSVWEPRG